MASKWRLALMWRGLSCRVAPLAAFQCVTGLCVALWLVHSSHEEWIAEGAHLHGWVDGRYYLACMEGKTKEATEQLYEICWVHWFWGMRIRLAQVKSRAQLAVTQIFLYGVYVLRHALTFKVTI